MAFEEVRPDVARQSETALHIRISWGQAMHIDLAVGASVGRSTQRTGLAGRTGDRIFTSRRQRIVARASLRNVCIRSISGSGPAHDVQKRAIV
jgi:hypothetical protein